MKMEPLVIPAPPPPPPPPRFTVIGPTETYCRAFVASSIRLFSCQRFVSPGGTSAWATLACVPNPTQYRPPTSVPETAPLVVTGIVTSIGQTVFVPMNCGVDSGVNVMNLNCPRYG